MRRYHDRHHSVKKTAVVAGAAGPSVGPSVAEILNWHAGGSGSPTKTAARVADAIAAGGDDGTWLSVVPRDQLIAAADAIEQRPAARTLPLYGVPFGVKDSIDVDGVPTTLSCPDYAYVAATTAPAVRRLLDAGALYVGKTNLDQFATGLNGTRTPYTVPRSVYGNDMISGGSSSGSALAVALGQVPFCVATDTAGSGRVPAALNGVVGYKPSRGLISTVGLVPACRSLDCISVMAGCIDDLDRVLDVMAARDDNDAWSRERGPRYDGSDIRVGLPPVDELDFFGDDAMRRAHLAFREHLANTATTVDVSLEPFLAAGSLLYQGPWVAERLVEFGDFLAAQPDSIHPVVRDILRGGLKYTAVDAFAALQRLAELKAVVGRLWHHMDVLVVPTIGTTFTVDEVLARPIDTNTMLGHYTHFGNLLDLLGVALPAGTTTDGRPHSAMLLGAAQSDDTVLALAARILDEPRESRGMATISGLTVPSEERS
ncbi:MAG TPA: allophanate hydrolase [Mycobacterium sp.]|nr:allophanate hydrolase [Mycobacterium sp.]